MLRIIFLILITISHGALAQNTTETQTMASIKTIRSTCSEACIGRHAIIFVHGIYGGGDTFTYEGTSNTPSFNWPENVPDSIAGSPVDVYVIEYQTQLLSWVKKDIASIDQVVEAISPRLKILREKKYSSINFVGHSLGGNVIAAYLHSVKSLEGHGEYAKHGFVLTVGTPVSGAAIANIGALLKDILGMSDPLLESLKKDNTFLRMMSYWAEQTNIKGSKFLCRPISLYAGIETKPLGPIQIVNVQSSKDALPARAISREFERNHSDIAKPKNKQDEIFIWFIETSTKEIERINAWNAPLCQKYL